jgi:hypothetical protein
MIALANQQTKTQDLKYFQLKLKKTIFVLTMSKWMGISMNLIFELLFKEILKILKTDFQILYLVLIIIKTSFNSITLF